jgi:hypothetical protein
VAIDFLLSDAAFEKSGITNITLPAPATASDGWAIGLWFRLKSSIADVNDRNFINQILQLAPTTNGAWSNLGTVNIWWASLSNTNSIDGVELASGRFYAVPTGWVANDNSNAGNWSDVTFPAVDINRLLILQLVNVAGSWKLRLYVTAQNAAATLVNESPVVTPAAIPVAHIRLGNRIPSPGNRDWRDIAGQLFILKRPLSAAEITTLATGSSAVTNVAASSDILGYWPAENPAAPLADLSGNGNPLIQNGAAASAAGFDFVSAGSTALAPASALHAHATQVSALASSGTAALAPTKGQHSHSAQSAALAFAATSLSRPTPHGDVDLALSTITNASSASPVVTLYGDPEANQSIPNSWHNLCARIDNVLGKTPQFTIANVHQWRNGAAAGLGLPQRGWRPWWRTSGGASTSWQRFDSYAISGNSISFANSAAFTSAAIEVAFFPVWNFTETSALFDAAYASGAGTEPPAAIAYRSSRLGLPLGTHNETAAVTSPDGIAVPVLPMRSVRISSASSLAPDGLPKRTAVLLFNIHAQEASGGWVADRFIRLLFSNAADAIWLRDRFIFDAYSVNNSGMVGGASRGAVEGWSGSGDLPDTNRYWPTSLSPPNSPLPELNDVAAAITTNSASKADVSLSFHSDALTSANFGLAYYTSDWDGLAAIKRFKDLLVAAPANISELASYDTTAPAATGFYLDQGFGRHMLGARLHWIQENSFATSDYIADSQTVAARLGAALRQITQEGMLALPVVGSQSRHSHSAAAALLAMPSALAAASARHSQAAQNAVLSVAGTLAAAQARHIQSAQSPALFATALLTIQRGAHTHAAQSSGLSPAGTLAPARSVHAHGGALPTLAVPGALLTTAARHAHRAQSATLTTPTSRPPQRREHSVPSERRILKLRFS